MILTVDQNNVGTSLLQYLKKHVDATVSVREIKRCIEANMCLVNGKVERHASTKLKKGDKVKFQLKQKVSDDTSRVLFEDDYLLIYNKPAGITSDGGLAKLFPDYEIVHRLDKETTGAIILAKTEDSAKLMKELFKKREIHKIYQVIVDGVPHQKSGTIESHIGKLSERGDYVIWGSVPPDRGRAATTAWKLLKEGKSASLIQCEPITGRTHQIRVHMKDMGHPVLGDYRYQRSFRCAYLPERLMLHAASIAFAHPFTHGKIKIEAPLPEDFQATLKRILV